MKTAKDYLDEANAVVPTVTPEEGISIHAGGEAVLSTYVTARASNAQVQLQEHIMCPEA